MPTPTTTVRLTGRDRAALRRLAEELVCKRTDVLRYGLVALLRDQALRDEIAAVNRARIFLKSLRTTYGENAVIELVDADADQWQIGGQDLPDSIGTDFVRQGDRWVLNLIDKQAGIGIRNALWTDDEGRRHATIALRDLHVYSPLPKAEEPNARLGLDGRTYVEIVEDNGEPRRFAIDDQGRQEQIEQTDIPYGERLTPSIGIGIRRESAFGPHLGEGVGGKWELTGDVAEDRAIVVDTLERLAEQARDGELDDLLTTLQTTDPT